MAKNQTPQSVAEKYVRRTTGAVQDMVNGVNAVTVSPTVKAVEKKDKLTQNWNAAMTSGKWERGMKRVTLDDWKKSMIEKGAPRVAAGVQAAAGKMTDFFAELIPFQDAAKAEIERMSDLTLEDSIQRMNAWTRKMASFKRRGA